MSNTFLCIAVVLSCLLKPCQAWSLGGTAPDVDTAATATTRRRSMENTFVDTENVDRNLRVGELDSECSLDGFVERMYDSNLDQYVYRDVQQDEIKIEDASPGKTNIPNARLYRKCNCHQGENTNNTNDNVFHRESNSNAQDATTIIPATTANNSNHNNPVQSMMLCPLEAQTCAVRYKDNIDTNTNNTIHRSLLHEHPHEENYYYHQWTTGIGQCYIVTPKAVKIRYYGSILQFWFSLLGIALVCTERGRQAIRFCIIKILGLLSWFKCCFSVCCLAQVPQDNDPALAYNTALAERILRREALVREIRRDQWEIQGMTLGPERDASELAYRSPIWDWWLIYQTKWRRSAREDTQQQSSNNNDANNSTIDEDEDEEQATSSSNNNTINNTSMMTNHYGEMRRKHGTRELFFRTKIYRKEENSGSENCGGDGDDNVANHDEQGDDNGDDNGNVNGSHMIASKNCACSSDSDGTIDENEVVCTICFGTIEDGDKIGNLDCNHLFHSSCLKTWIKRKNTCPVCLTPIALESSNLE